MGRWLTCRRRWTRLFWLALLATVAAGPVLLSPGFLNTRGGGDSPFLLFRLHQLVAALTDGHFPVRWMPDAAYGFGYPFFSYYAALPFYVGAALVFLGFGLIAAIKVTQWLGFLLAAVAVWGLVHHFVRQNSRNRTGGGRWAPWLAAAAYTFAPYHLVNIYVRGDSLTEFWAMGLYPLVLWMAARLSQRPGGGRIVVLALAYGALILTHNISALIASPLLLLFCLLLIIRHGRATGDWGARSWGPLAGGMFLGFVIAAFYWLPALGEQNAVQLGAQTSGYFNYANHFRGLSGDGAQLIQSSVVFDYDVAGGTPFAMGAVQAVLALSGVVAAVVGVRRKGRADWPLPAFAVAALLISTTMMTPLSRPIWERVPLLPLVQFPWRFLSLQALAVGLLTAELPRIGRPALWLAGALAAALALTSMVGLRPNSVALTTADVTAERLQLYEWFSGNVGTTIRYEYLPRAVVPRPYTSPAVMTGRPMVARFLTGEGSAHQTVGRTGRQEWEVDVSSGVAAVTFPTLYWPGWRARVDGQPVSLWPAESLGTITLDLPAGRHTVLLILGRTPLRLAAEWVSLLGLLVCLALGLDGLSRQMLRRGWRFALAALTLALLMALVLHAVPIHAFPDDDLTWDFAQEAYLHHNPDGVPFGQAAVMAGYQINQLAGAGSLEIAVRWKDVSRPDLQAELSLVSPAQVVRNVPYVVATDRQSLRSSEVRFTLGPLEAIAPGPLLLRLRVLDRDGVLVPALTATGESRGDLYLRPVWPEPPLQRAETAGVELLSAGAQQLDPESLAITLRWAVGEPLPANYGIALRLRDAAGVEWAALDTWPGYGYYPTSLWESGTAFEERLFLEVPYGLPPGLYTLTASLYDVVTLVPQWGPFQMPLSIDTPAPYDGRPLVHQFDGGLASAGIEVPGKLVQGDPLAFTVAWMTQVGSPRPAAARWELVGPASDVVASETAELGPWPAGTVVLGRYTLATGPSIPPGPYTLYLHLGEEDPWAAAIINVDERPRRFTLPEVETESGVVFGELIELAAYDLDQTDEAIRLTLFWRALEVIPADYIVFVHLYDPATEKIPVQSDAMPRAGAYPTSRWAPGEIVDDTITLALTEVSAGDYRLGLGLYRMENEDYPRLPALDSAGNPLPDGRAVLPPLIRVP
jgi:hypothetical protein